MDLSCTKGEECVSWVSLIKDEEYVLWVQHPANVNNMYHGFKANQRWRACVMGLNLIEGEQCVSLGEHNRVPALFSWNQNRNQWFLEWRNSNCLHWSFIIWNRSRNGQFGARELFSSEFFWSNSSHYTSITFGGTRLCSPLIVIW